MAASFPEYYCENLCARAGGRDPPAAAKHDISGQAAAPSAGDICAAAFHLPAAQWLPTCMGQGSQRGSMNAACLLSPSWAATATS